MKKFFLKSLLFVTRKDDVFLTILLFNALYVFYILIAVLVFGYSFPEDAWAVTHIGLPLELLILLYLYEKGLLAKWNKHLSLKLEVLNKDIENED